MAKKEATEKPKRKVNPALMKPLQPDEVLSAVIGETPVSRGETVKKLWDYIKAHNLQDENNKRMINADDKLIGFFDGQKQISMFDLAKLIGKHVS